MDRHTETPDISRRTFLTATSAVLVGAALGGLAPQSDGGASGIRNGAASCNMARAPMWLASTRIGIIRTTKYMPPPRCITA